MVPPAGGALRARTHATGDTRTYLHQQNALSSGVQRIHCTPMGTATRHEVSPPVEAPQQEAQAPPQTMPPRGVGHSPRITPCLREDAGRSSSRVPSCGHLLLSRSRSPRPASFTHAHPSRSHSRSAFLRLSLWGASRRAFFGAVPSGVGGGLRWGYVRCLRVGCFLGRGWWVCGGVLCLRADLPSTCGVGLLRLRLLQAWCFLRGGWFWMRQGVFLVFCGGCGFWGWRYCCSGGFVCAEHGLCRYR